MVYLRSKLIKRFAFRTVCGFTLGWLLCGCGESEKASQEEGVSEIVWMIPLDLDRSIYNSLLDRFHELNPDIRVRPRWVPSSQYQTKFKILAASGLMPDVFYCGDVWVAYLAPFLEDLTPYVERDLDELELADIPQRLQDACLYDGKWTMLPRSFTVSLLYYNRTIFDAAGEPYPDRSWNWDDYLQTAQRLTQGDADGKVAIWGSTVETGWWGEWLTLVRQSGARLFDDEISKCLLDSEQAVEAMSFYMSKIEKGAAPAPGKGPALGFEGGRYGMKWGGHTNDWASVYGKLPDFKWDVEVLPAGPTGRGGAELAIDAYGISNTTEDKEACWKLVKFLTSPEAAEVNARYGFLVPRRSVLERVFSDPKNSNPPPANWRCIFEAINNSGSIPRSPNFIEIAIDIIQPEFDRMTSGLMSAEEACRKAAVAANAYIEVLATRK